MSKLEEVLRLVLDECSREILEVMRNEWEVDDTDLCFYNSKCWESKDNYEVRTAQTEEYYFEFDSEKKEYENRREDMTAPVYPLYRVDQLISLLENRRYFVKIETLSRIGFRVNLIKREENITNTNKDLWLCLYKLFIQTYDSVQTIKEVNAFK